MRNRPGSLLIVVAAATMATAFAGCGGEVVVPDSYDVWDSGEGSFAIEYPTGWKSEGNSKRNAWAKFTSGSALIRVETNVTGSLIGDMASTGMGDMAGMDLAAKDMEELAPVAKVHEFEKDLFAQNYNGYEETAIETVRTGLGDTRKAEFTAAGSFGGELKGYRATALGPEKRVRVTCACSADDWETLQPVFEHVVESLGRGKAQ